MEGLLRMNKAGFDPNTARREMMQRSKHRNALSGKDASLWFSVGLSNPVSFESILLMKDPQER